MSILNGKINNNIKNGLIIHEQVNITGRPNPAWDISAVCIPGIHLIYTWNKTDRHTDIATLTILNLVRKLIKKSLLKNKKCSFNYNSIES